MSDVNIGLFPTPVLKCNNFLNTSEVSDIFQILKNKIIHKHEVIVGGKSSHNPNGHENIIETLGLKNRIQEKLNIYTNNLKIHKVSILSYWFNIQDIGSVLKLHMHTQSLLSAALYVNVDEKSSPIFFYNPNSTSHYSFSMHGRTQAGFNMHHQAFKPKNGEMIIFPSWLLHGSDDVQNQTKDRTVISFNAGYKN